MLTRLLMRAYRCWYSVRVNLPYVILVIVFGLACDVTINHFGFGRSYSSSIKRLVSDVGQTIYTRLVSDVGQTTPTRLVSDVGQTTPTRLVGDVGQTQPTRLANDLIKTTHTSRAGKEKLGKSCSPDQGTVEQLMEHGRLMRVHEASCSTLFSGDEDSLKAALGIVETLNESLDTDFYLNITRNCDVFHKSRGYITSSLTQEERDFPIAFSLVVYTDLEMAERLLRAIYRPQNFYCVHVDKKVSSEYFMAISSIIRCLPNVFLSSRRFNVRWGKFSVLQAELVCMRDLWKFKTWKYFINLTGQEFPLRTNLELVRILKAYKGANDVRGLIRTANKRRWRNTSPPIGIRPVKGSVHITASRSYVDYVLHNETARAILLWTMQTDIPDETFFATINYNPQLGVAGAYTGDLPRLGQARHLFANKFMLNEDRLVIGCLEERLANHTRDEYTCAKVFNASYYSNLEFVKKRFISVT